MNPTVTTPKIALSALALALLLPSAASHAAAITYDTAGVAYTQDFDSLGSTGAAWTNGTTLTGWHWVGEGGTTPATYTATDGGTAVGNQILSVGSTSLNPTDRAFGGQNGNNVATLYYGAQILNSTGDTLSTFSLTYTGEQWRRIQNEAADQLTFQYQIFNAGEGSLSAASGWNAVGALTFTAPTTSSQSSAGIDGNLLANRTTISSTVSGFSWSEGQEIWLRWTDNNPANNSSASRRAVMGIDDLSFSATSAIPEPSSYAVVFGALSLGLAACQRRRRSDAQKIS
jgi:hypothetical protein